MNDETNNRFNWIVNLYNKYGRDVYANVKVYEHYKEALSKKIIPQSMEKETFKRLCRRIRLKLTKSNCDSINNSNKNQEQSYQENHDVNTLEISLKESSDTPVEDLLKRFKVNLDDWIITFKKLNSWDSPFKNEFGELTSKKMYQSKISLIAKEPKEQKFPTVKKISFNVDLSLKNNKEPVKIKRSLVFADTHFGFRRNFESNKLEPFHCRKTLDIILQVATKEQPEEILMLGDMLDCAELGKFVKEPEFYLTLQPAINEFGFILAKLRKNCPNTKIILQGGNHDDARLKKQIMENFTFAYNLKAFNKNTPVLSLKNLLSLDELNIEYVGDYPKGEYWINRSLKAIHGEFINPKKNIESNTFSIIAGHLHKEYIETKTITDYKNQKRFIKIISIPATCRVDGFVPASTSSPNWQRGFTMIESFEDKFNTTTYLIYSDDTCLVNGNLYKGEDYSTKHYLDKSI